MSWNGINRLMPMAALYGSRVGVAALGLIVLPWLQRLMPAEAFGLAATMLSLQALAVVFDLGLAVTISREMPLIQDSARRIEVVKQSETTLLRTYFAITLAILALTLVGVIPISRPIALLASLSLLVIVWQNIILVALMSQKRFVASSIGQFAGLALRHLLSLAFVIVTDGKLEGFLWGQLLGGGISLAASRIAFFAGNRSADAPVLGRNRPPTTSIAMMVYTASGALAVQLDKPLVSMLASPDYTGPYFLATTLALVPITFLAGPVAQFIQPRLIASLVEGSPAEAMIWIRRLTLAIIVLAIVPGALLWMAADSVASLWLQNAPIKDVVVHYVSLLLPGTMIGALGYVPVIILLARKDYWMLAAISVSTGMAVLGATSILSSSNNIAGVSLAYAVYHSMTTLALWVRALYVGPAFHLRQLASHRRNDIH